MCLIVLQLGGYEKAVQDNFFLNFDAIKEIEYLGNS